MKSYSPLEGPVLENFMEDCLLWEGTCAGAEECEKDRGAAIMNDKLTTASILLPSVLLGRRR